MSTEAQTSTSAPVMTWYQKMLSQHKTAAAKDSQDEESLFANLTPRDDSNEHLIDEHLLKISKRMMKYRLNVFLL